jgi:hypothetical protein
MTEANVGSISKYKSIMTFVEVAEMLRTKVSSVKMMTRTRRQESDRFPIPFRHIGGRVVFLRGQIYEWRERMFEYDEKRQAARLALKKGKRVKR